MCQIKQKHLILDFKKLKIISKDFILAPLTNSSSNFSKKKSISSLFIIMEGDTIKWFEFEESLTAAKILCFSYSSHEITVAVNFFKKKDLSLISFIGNFSIIFAISVEKDLNIIPFNIKWGPHHAPDLIGWWRIYFK